MKKSFLLWNTDACMLGIAQRLEEEGYPTFSYYSTSSEKFAKGAGKGITNVVDDMYDVLFDFKDRKDDLIIIIDGNDRGDECDYLRSEGWHLIGSSHYTEEIEHERDEGDALAQEIGLNLPPSVSFTDFGKAIEYLKKLDDDIKLVFKGDGLDMAGSSFTYLANTVGEMIKQTNWVKQGADSGKYKIDKFSYHEVVDGIEVDFAGWFNGKSFVPAMFVDFEQKRIHGLGAAVGCLGQIETFLDATKEPYFMEYIAKLQPKLKGDVANEWAINNIVDEKDGKCYFLEFTPRLGWDSTVGELALLKDAGKSIGEYFEMIAFQKPFPKDYFPFGRYSCSVRLYTGSTGHEYECIKGKPLFWDQKYNDNLWWYGIKQCDEDYEICGNPVGVAVACGDTPEEAMLKVYEIIDPRNNHIVIPDIFYSETIGEKVSDKIKELKSLGVLNNDK